MKDISKEIQFRDKTYKVVFNLNVMETIQEEYGTIDTWTELSDGQRAKRDANGEIMIDDEGNTVFETVEPNAKAVIFGLTEMINEGIMIDNEENGKNEPLLTKRQVGRIITEVGLQNATKVLNDTVIESVQSNEKNA